MSGWLSWQGVEKPEGCGFVSFLVLPRDNSVGYASDQWVVASVSFFVGTGCSKSRLRSGETFTLPFANRRNFTCSQRTNGELCGVLATKLIPAYTKYMHAEYPKINCREVCFDGVLLFTHFLTDVFLRGAKQFLFSSREGTQVLALHVRSPRALFPF